MSLWAIVPVKPLRMSKPQLSDVLDEEERLTLNLTMLGNTLQVLSSVQEIDQVLVISRDSSVLSMSRDYGARTLQEDPNSPLEVVLQRAAAVARAYAARALLIVAADLPLLAPEDVQTMLAHAVQPPEMIIAPDRKMDGVNVVLINPIEMFKVTFGKGSVERYQKQAVARGTRLEILSLPTLAFDLDSPEDLEYLNQVEQV